MNRLRRFLMPLLVMLAVVGFASAVSMVSATPAYAQGGGTARL